VVVRCRLSFENDFSGVEPVDGQTWQTGPRTLMGVFENPQDRMAEDLLEEAGCRRLYSGGARVPESSANAVSTTTTCSAADVIRLVGTMRQRVLDRFGIALESKIRFIDEEGRKIQP
jgi:UDP-N-acetylenolpyruvoylglucosamine reductase